MSSSWAPAHTCVRASRSARSATPATRGLRRRICTSAFIAAARGRLIRFRSSSRGRRGRRQSPPTRMRWGRGGACRAATCDCAPLLPSLRRLSAICRSTPLYTSMARYRYWYRVQLPDGTAGIVSGRLTESTGQPVRTAHAGAVLLLDRPMVTAAPIADLEVPRLPVLGRFDNFLFVRTPDGREGWILL